MKYKQMLDYLLESPGATIRIKPEQDSKIVARAIRSGIWRCQQRYNQLLEQAGRPTIDHSLIITERATETGTELELTLKPEYSKSQVQFQVVTPNVQAVDTTSLPD